MTWALVVYSYLTISKLIPIIVVVDLVYVLIIFSKFLYETIEDEELKVADRFLNIFPKKSMVILTIVAVLLPNMNTVKYMAVAYLAEEAVENKVELQVFLEKSLDKLDEKFKEYIKLIKE